MGYRRKSRELALQALFYLESNQSDQNQADPDGSEIEKEDQEELEELINHFCLSFEEKITESTKPFFLLLVKGVINNKAELDSLLDSCSKNWKLSRMSSVDKNIMRIGAFELLKCQDIPSSVTINEAVEIGKKFGAKDSASFINGVLDKIRILKNIE